MKVAVIGASNKTHRYSYQAVMLLKEKGHEVYPVHPRVKEIEGLLTYESIGDVQDEIDTVTMYVGEKFSNEIAVDILNKNPKRSIFNPGAENSALEEKAKEKGIETMNACTLVMLRTGQF